MKLEKKVLSIIFPLFNESVRLPPSLKVIKKYYENKSYLGEIIFVDDGSNDNTLKVIKKFKAKFPIKIISYGTNKLPRSKLTRYSGTSPEKFVSLLPSSVQQAVRISASRNKGKGFAIKKGVLKASMPIILFMDIDLSTSLEMTEKFLNEFEKNTLLIGNRESPQSKLTKRQSYLRERMGLAFTRLTNMILGINCSDYTCGFKMFPANIGKKIFSKAKINRWGFDAELIFLAKKMGVKVKELPVIWEHKGNSKVNLKKDIFYSLFELLKIRFS